MSTYEQRAKGKNGQRKEAPAEIIVLPFSIEAERRVIGTIFADNERYDDIADKIKSADFYDETHRAIWDIITDRIPRGLKATPILVHGVFPSADGGSETLLADMQKMVALAVPGNLLAYVTIIRDHAESRTTHALCTEHGTKALDKSNTGTLATLRTAIDEALDPIGEEEDSDKAWEEVANRAAELFQSRGQSLGGITTGLRSVDAIVPPMRAGNSIILAGVSGHGKTTIAMQAIYNNAKAGNPTALFTLEMSKAEVRQKLASMLSGVPEDLIDAGGISEEQYRVYVDAVKHLQTLPIAIERRLPCSPALLHARCRSLNRKFHDLGGLKFVVVDYLGLLKPDTKTSGAYEKATALSNTMKQVAGQLEIPIMTLCQLNREVYKRPNKKPVLSDLRDSGNIEADADMVIFVQKQQAMIELDQPVKSDFKDQGSFHEVDEAWQQRWQDASGMTTVYLAKSRRTGKTGSVDLKYSSGLFRDTQKDPLTNS
jgi:replicative DNA helicase